MVGIMIPMLYDIKFSNAVHISTVLAVAGIVFCVLWYKYYRINRVLSRLVSPIWYSLLVKHGSKIKRMCKFFLFYAGIIGLLLAILRPSWDKKRKV